MQMRCGAPVDHVDLHTLLLGLPLHLAYMTSGPRNRLQCVTTSDTPLNRGSIALRERRPTDKPMGSTDYLPSSETAGTAGGAATPFDASRFPCQKRQSNAGTSPRRRSTLSQSGQDTWVRLGNGYHPTFAVKLYPNNEQESPSPSQIDEPQEG